MEKEGKGEEIEKKQCATLDLFLIGFLVKF